VRRGNTVTLRKDLIEWIAIGADTINYSGYANEKTYAKAESEESRDSSSSTPISSSPITMKNMSAKAKGKEPLPYLFIFLKVSRATPLHKPLRQKRPTNRIMDILIPWNLLMNNAAQHRLRMTSWVFHKFSDKHQISLFCPVMTNRINF
jgi:hypothetical protein